MRSLLLLSLALVGASACDTQATAKTCRHQAVVSPAAAARPLPELTGRVVDMAKLIGPLAEERLAGQLAALEAETSDQLIVVTIASLGGEPIEEFGLRAGNGWRIGQEGIGNGVLLIVAPAERSARIEVGCGLEGLLTDEKAQQIMDRQLIPRFAAGEFEAGIDAGVAAISAVLRADRKRPQPWKEPADS